MIKILFVDDSEALLDLIILMLGSKGLEVKGATGKEEMYRQLTSFAPDVILLDIRLERENGRNICKELKSHPEFRSIPVILISASTDELEKYEECGADDIIQKPFDIQTVIVKSDRLLQKQFK